jgi:hypothetical protein
MDLYVWSKTALAVLKCPPFANINGGCALLIHPTRLCSAHPLPLPTAKHWLAELQFSLLKQLKLFYSKQA